MLSPKPAAAEGEAPKDDGHGDTKKADKGGGHGGKGGGEPDPALGKITEGPDGVTFYTLPDMVVNIQTADGRPAYLKLRLTLELEDAHLADQLMAEMPRLQDMFQGFLRELRTEDLNGSAGNFQLRAEILRRVNLILAPGKAEAVLIEEMLVN
jgi:flagellar protein FliL